MTAEHADALVFFGATGDLAYKQIFPALQALVQRGRLDLPVVGVALSGWSLEQLRARARASLQAQGGVDEAAFARLAARLQYVDGDYNDPSTYARLRAALGPARRPLHYLAIPPSMFATVATGLANAGCTLGARVVVEKPFGRDFASARELNRILHEQFPEQAIFRIDHYLGKEPVQNILYSRFSNIWLEPILNRVYVDHVQITMAEQFDVAGRGRFYEEAGAIRDVVQNHMLQLAACVLMEPPTGSTPEPVRDAKGTLIKAMRNLQPEDVVRGQYRGYRDEAGVAPDSRVETYAAVRLMVDTWRWSGVPIYIRAGKALPVTACEVVVRFRRPPFSPFGEELTSASNYLRFQLNPDILIALGTRVKRGGEIMAGEAVELEVMRSTQYTLKPYERLLGDAMAGDATLFARQDEVEAAWEVVDPVLGEVTPVYQYEKQSWGPAEAATLAPPGGWYAPPTREAALHAQAAAATSG